MKHPIVGNTCAWKGVHCERCQMDEVWRTALRMPAVCPDTRGLGDLVERLAKPVAKALGLKCLDQHGNLRPESRCGERKRRLNEAIRVI